MTTYTYEGLDRAGRAQKGMAEAPTVKEAREKLLKEGVFAERLTAVGQTRSLDTELRATIYRELGALIGAGLPLDQAVDLLVKSEELAGVQSLLAGIRDNIREGMPFSAALVRASASVSPFEVAIMQAAERSASMDRMLDHLASFIEDQARIRGRVEATLTYPLIVFVAGICVALLMLGLLVPRAGALLTESGVALPLLTRFMLVVGRVSLYAAVPLIASIVFGVGYARKRWKRETEFAQRWSRRFFDVPLFGEGYRLLVTLRFVKTMAILIQGGVSLIDALVLSGRATGCPWIAVRCEEESESVRHGAQLSDAVARIGPLGEALPGLLRVGEAGGGLYQLMEKAGHRYQEKWDRHMQKRLTLLEPALILIVGAFVLMVTLSILLPILTMTRSIAP